MASQTSGRDPVEKLAEEFAERYRRGERPSLGEYTDRYPELADQIRELFPALVEMEQLGSLESPPTGPHLPAVPGDGIMSRQLGEYRIVRQVGRGGMGVVYEAVQESLGRHVALKVLPQHGLLSPTHLERFKRETKAAARLHHTNIVPVFGVGEDSGIHYYAMQFIQGQSLDMVLDELRRLRGVHGQKTVADLSHEVSVRVAQGLLSGRFAEPEPPAEEPSPESARAAPGPAGPRPESAFQGADGSEGSSSSVSGVQTHFANQSEAQYFRGVAQMGVQVAEALAYAHRQGILHRDIKPSNLLMDLQGTVWITDFGLAKAEGSDDLTHTGDIVGTLRFMAPERFAGRCDRSSEVYSVGITLYELLTLRPAFEATDRPRLIERVLHEDPPRPRQVDPNIPRDLETVVLKAIAKDPADRYPTAEALADDLRRFLADRPIRARRSSVAERTWRWCRRNPAVASLTGLAALLLVVIAVGASVGNVILSQQLHRAEEAERDGKAKLWQAHLDRANARRVSRRPGQRFDSLRAVQEALKLPVPPGRSLDELRNEAIAALVLPDLEVVKEWDGLLPSTNSCTFDGGLQRYAREEKGGAVSIRRVEDDAELLPLPGLGPLHDYLGLQFSPDGRFLHRFYRRDGQWRGNLCRIDGPRPVVLLDAAYQGGVAFSPDSRQLAAAYPGIALCFYDVASGRELRRFPLKDVDACGRWNPRAPQVAIYCGKFIRVVHVETGQILAEWAVPGRPDWMDWHPAGRVLAVSTYDLKIRLWDSVTRQPVLPPLEGHKNGGVVLRFHPAGDLLASNDWDGILRLWDVNTGRQVLAQHGWGLWPQFRTPEGCLLAGGDGGKRRLSRCARGNEFRTLPVPNKGSYEAPLLDADGRLLAVRTGDGIHVIDLFDGQIAAKLPAPADWPVLFEPSGALLTSGAKRLFRWPRTLNSRTGLCRFGPPELLDERPGRGSADGRVLVLVHNSGATVLYRDTGRQVVLQPQEDVRNSALSPDGRWAATGSFHTRQGGAGAKVWDAQGGKLVKELPVGGLCSVAFSPDGRWLATGGGGCRLWRVGTWDEGPKVGGGAFAFSPDSRVLAVAGEAGVVRLVDPDTGREYARLTGPDPIRLSPACFTPDGAQLITQGSETRAIHIFDLRAIRRQLAEMGLDWNLPPYPPVDKKQDAAPLQIKVDLGKLAPAPIPPEQSETDKLRQEAEKKSQAIAK
jgi:serine/threonine protein kinase/WD40 repeat protein